MSRILFSKIGLIALMCLPFTWSGCSYLFVSGPPDNKARPDSFDCTTSNGWPIFDAIYGTINTAADLAMASRAGSNQGVYAVGALGSAVLWGSSSMVGFGRTSRCREAKGQEEKEDEEGPMTQRQWMQHQRQQQWFEQHQQVLQRPALASLHEKKAKELFEAELFTEAASEFQMAFKASNDPAFLYNEALCYRRAGSIKLALAAYEDYLRAVPDSPLRSTVEARIKELKRQLAGERETSSPQSP